MFRLYSLVALTAAISAFSASAAVNIQLNDGSASFATAAAGVFGAPFDHSTLPDTNLYLDGPGTFDYLSKYCWYYRSSTSNSGRTVPFSYAGQPVITGSGSAQRALWGTDKVASPAGIARFSGDLSMQLTRTGIAQSNLSANMRITADPNNSGVQAFEIFALLDPTLSVGVNNGLSDSAQVMAASNTSTTTFVDGSGRYVEYAAKDATRYEVGPTSTVKGRLAADANNLSNNPSVGSTDAAAAYQWTLVLNPGESRLLETAFSINQPASFAVIPEPACLGASAIALPFVTRRRNRTFLG